MGIINELQLEATLSNDDISNLIRKAYIVAKKLDLEKFQDWLCNELNGYKDYNEIPQYRNVICDLFGWNPYNGWIPVMLYDSELNDTLTHRKIPDSIVYLAKLRNGSDTAHVPLPNDVRNLLSKINDFDTKYIVRFNTSYIDGIVEIVRNNILEWALNLEKEGIVGDNMTFTQYEKEIAKSSSNVYISNVGNLMFQQNCNNPTQIQNNTEDLSDEQIKKLNDLLEFIRDNIYKIEEFDASKIDVINKEIKTIDEYKKSNKLTKKVLKEGLHTIRNILEGVTGSVIASGIIYHLGLFSNVL